MACPLCFSSDDNEVVDVHSHCCDQTDPSCPMYAIALRDFLAKFPEFVSARDERKTFALRDGDEVIAYGVMTVSRDH